MKELAEALNKFQSQLEPALKDKSNPFFKSKYADLASCWEAIKKPLTDNGLSIIQRVDVIEGNLTVLKTMILHKSGEFLEGAIPLTPLKADPQSYGSMLSYFRRYCLAAITGLVQEDDDANLASKEPEKPKLMAGVEAKRKYIFVQLNKLGMKYDSPATKSMMSRLTGKLSSSEWNMADAEKVENHLDNLINEEGRKLK
jgi:hypothetical protein